MRAIESVPSRALNSGRTSPASGAWLDAWHVNPSTNKDYDVIDGLRGIAILMVIACHLIYVNPAAGPAVLFAGGFFGAGAWGVTLFFTLSGFLISHPFWKRKISKVEPLMPRGYGWRRFWKIYPPLALSIVLLLPGYYFMRKTDVGYLAIAGQWLAGWPIVHSIAGGFNPVMWSLIVEVHFYLLLPLLFLCMKRLSAKACLWSIFGILLVVPAAYRWWNLRHGIQLELFPEVQVHFPSLLDAFALGVLIAGIENMYSLPKKCARLGDLGCVLLAVCMAARSWLSLHPILSPEIQLELLAAVVRIAAALMLCYVADQSHPRTRLLSAPWLRWCGLISYEWYLFHQPVTLWARDLIGPAGGSIAKFGLIVGGSLVVGLAMGAIVYRYFSLPILRYGRDRNRVR